MFFLSSKFYISKKIKVCDLYKLRKNKIKLKYSCKSISLQMVIISLIKENDLLFLSVKN